MCDYFASIQSLQQIDLVSTWPNLSGQILFLTTTMLCTRQWESIAAISYIMCGSSVSEDTIISGDSYQRG